ncbi:MAG: LPS assembly protein LptD [Alphaproteobacteria bacterium]|nr:LPS assembly protein LptD [Alphaproteobacteria bacterium]
MICTLLICLFSGGLSSYALAKAGEGQSGQSLLFGDNSRFNGRHVSTRSAVVETGNAAPDILNINQEVESIFETKNIEERESDQKAGELSEDPVDLVADRVEYDEIAGIVSAIGTVELVQSGRILRADKIDYNLTQDRVEARGNIVLNEVTGDTYFGDHVELQDKMKDGFVEGLKGVLADGSRFSAEEAEKVGDIKLIMRRAKYTPCEPCKNDPDRAPLWQIVAGEVTHHKDEQRVSYQDATFEVSGVPVAYAPYFSHPDGSVKRKSGFLTPTIGFDSQLGTNYAQEYYWSIAPNQDATFGAMFMTQEAPLLTGEYRYRFEEAEIQLEGGTTYSSRIDQVAGQNISRDKEVRGHLFAEGIWDINDKWRAGTEMALVSDEQFLRQYDITNEDVLENKLYAERFDDRNYAIGQFIRFKDIRVSEREVDQPDVLPQIYTRFLGDPNGLLGGRWSVEASALGLHREGDDQDLGRGTLELGWQTHRATSWGVVNTLDLSARGDAYRVGDRDIADNNSARSSHSSALRGFAQAHYQASFPVQRQFESAQMVVEPLGALTAGTNLNDNSNDIPNEDSQDVSLNTLNLFSPNRFPGHDRIEDETRATYGVRTGLYADNGYQGEVFFGQSYRFDKNDNPFPGGSGLSEQESDFVGNVATQLGENLRLHYDFQLANDSLRSQRHEVDASGKVGRLSLNTRYFYASALQGTDLDQSREQIRTSGRFRVTDEWSVLGSAQYDLARETEGLRRTSYGLDYQGQCVTFQITGHRTLTKDSSGDSGTEIMMRLGLKNLGEFQTSGLSVGADE